MRHLRSRPRRTRVATDGTGWLGALDAALAEIPTPAVIIGDGDLLHANAAGRAHLEHGADTAVAHPDDARVVPVVRADGVHAFLVLFARPCTTTPSPEGMERLARAARRWSLTARQRQILAHLVRGESNKEIASELGCSIANVEALLTTIMRKSATASRAELLVKYWST